MVQRVQEALNAALAGDEEDIQFAAPEMLPDFNQKPDEEEVSSSLCPSSFVTCPCSRSPCWVKRIHIAEPSEAQVSNAQEVIERSQG